MPKTYEKIDNKIVRETALAEQVVDFDIEATRKNLVVWELQRDRLEAKIERANLILAEADKK